MKPGRALPPLLADIRACTLCADELEPRPVLRVRADSRILIVGQAPGSRVHASGIPWQDASGAHLREWLDVDQTTFDDARLFGIVPMGFCYPGRGQNADLPPPPRCHQAWHAPLLSALEPQEDRVLLLVGMHAQAHYLRGRKKRTLTETVKAFESYGPGFFPLPHPSWRSKGWMKRNPWFEARVLPALRARVMHARLGLVAK